MSVVKTVVTAAAAVWALGFTLILWTAPVAATTLTAASCSSSDVNAAVGAAVNGDIVVVPAGNCAWATGLTISKAITLKGAGIGKTLITNNITTGHLIVVTESTAGNIRIEGFDFRTGTGGGPNPGCNPCHFISVSYTTNGRPVLITANSFSLTSSRNALGFKTNRGVIWANRVTATVSGSACLNNASFLRHKPLPLTGSWTSRSTWGAADTNGDQNLYVESNTFYDVLEAVDVDDNARIVLRYNSVTNSHFGHHGADTSPSGGRYSEIYNNTFVWDTSPKCGTQPTNLNNFITLRGGSTLIHNNVIPNLTSTAWGNKFEVGFTVRNLRDNKGPYPCWNQGYPAPHQVGWGYTTGGTRAGTTSVLQDLEPVYLWNNTGAGNYGSPSAYDFTTDACFTGQVSATYIREGRDYYVDTAKPGYTPFIYPHPLTGSQGSPTASNPPTGVTVH
jgi:hypothetical protein